MRTVKLGEMSRALVEAIRNLKSVDELPESLNDYINFLEKELNIPIVIVSVGPDRKETLFR